MTVPAGDKLTLSEVRHKQGPKDTAGGERYNDGGKEGRCARSWCNFLQKLKGIEEAKKKKRGKKERGYRRRERVKEKAREK